MKKFLLAGMALLVMCCMALADVQIDAKHRIANKQPGYCAWCCLETLGRHQGIKRLAGLMEARSKDEDWVEKQLVQIGPNLFMEQQQVVPKNLGSVGAIRHKLDSLKIKYRITRWNYEHLADAVKDKGCVVFMRPNKLMPGPHAVILVELTGTIFRYIDPNGCYRWQGSREWFDCYWDGIAISIKS